MNNNEIKQVRTLNNNSQWLKHLFSENVMTKEFVVSLCAELEGNKEFTNLIIDIQKLSSELATSSQLSKSSCYDNLKQTNSEIASKMLMMEHILTNQVLIENNNPHKFETHSHAGFVNYLYYAWANEFGICIRPDMLYYTIISETIEHIISKENNVTENKYFNLFKKEREPIRFERSCETNYEISKNEIENIVNSVINQPDFKKHIIDIQFDSQPDNFNVALNMCFLKQIPENIRKIDSKCGITMVEVLGSEREWTNLLDTIAKLSTFVPELGDYYVKCTLAINKLVVSRFNTNELSESVISEKMIEYLSEIFWVEGECDSNHITLAKGWFRDFFIDEYDSIEQYPTHSHFVPYIVNNKNFIKVCGLNYSNMNDNILYPQYGESTYEVKHNKIFELLLGNKDVVLIDENKVKDMIKSTMINAGCDPSDNQIKEVYDSMISNDEKNNQTNQPNQHNQTNQSNEQNQSNQSNQSNGNILNASDKNNQINQTNQINHDINKNNLSTKLHNAFKIITNNTPNTVKKNWKTTLIVTGIALLATTTIFLSKM